MLRLTLSLLLLLQTTATVQRIRRIAILDFENASPGRKFDSFKLGLAETMRQELIRIPTLTLVDRSNLSDVLKEIRLGQSALIKPGTAKQAGKGLAADSLLAGSFQIVGNEVRLAARIIDVETRVVRAAAEVNGALRDILKLESELASKLIVEIQQAPLTLEPLPDRNFDAFQMFSDGLYFLRNDHLKDALARFDRALALDPAYVDAQFQRGLVLKKLQRWDEAVASFKSVLPRSKPERRVAWSWDAPFAAGSEHGIFAGLDVTHIRSDLARLQKRILFGERKDKATTVYLPDLGHHRVQQLELPDEHVRFNEIALANDRLTLLFSVDVASPRPDKLGLYAVSAADNSLWWHVEIPAIAGQLPMVGLTPDAFYTYSPADGRLSLFDDQTRRQRWTREGVMLDKLLPPILAGGLMIAKTGNSYHAMRLSDGSDAWTVAASSAPIEMANDQALVVFEPKSRFFVVDIPTGRTILNAAIPQSVETVNLGVFGSKEAVKAVIEENALYFVSSALELVAVDLKAGMVQSKTPLKAKVFSLRAQNGRAYAGTDSGELIVIEPAQGKILARTRLAPRALSVDHVANDVVVASADTAIFGLEPSGRKRWEHPSTVAAGSAIVFKGIVAARTAATQITTLDAKTGEVLWQYVAQPLSGLHLTEDALFMVEQNGIREFSLDRPAVRVRGTGDKEVLTELAGALLAKSDAIEAREYIDAVKALDPDYPPLRLLLGDLATYANLVGRDSRAGQLAIAELKSKRGLLWATTLDGTVLGSPTMVANRLINIGRFTGMDAPLVAINPSSGATSWRLPSERLIDSVTDDVTRLWYVSGQASNPAGLALYQVKVESGERRELARWSAPFTINSVVMSYAANRLFVASLSLNLQTNLMHAGIDCFDAVSGARLWQKTHEAVLNLFEMRAPLGLFVPQGDNLVYSILHDIWAVRANDGMLLNQQREDDIIAPNPKRRAAPAGPLYYVTGRELVAYDVDRKGLTRQSRPAVESPPLTIRDGVLFGTASNGAAAAFDLKSGEKWRVAGKFRAVIDGDAYLFALREDDVVVILDRSTGKVVGEQSTLWRSIGMKVIGNRLYALTADGLAYAIKMPSF